MAGGRINYQVGFNVDKTGLNQLKTSLQEVRNLANQALNGVNTSGLNLADEEVKQIISSVNELDGALERAFNTNLGTLNISKFNQEISRLNLGRIQQDMSKVGSAGSNAFRNITAQILTTNMQLKQSYTLLDSMAETMGNTIKWGIASSALNNVAGSVKKAFNYTKQLDTALNNIRIVTGQSADDMDRFARQANKAAKELKSTTKEYAEAALIYYQQGLDEQDVKARTDVTMKVANVTGQAGEEVSEQLTAVWNGYKVSAQEAENYIDKLSAVAATTAADLEELSVGMSKVASAANIMGVDVDQLNAQLATVVSVTREAPETIGTSFKTIFARMGDIEAGLDGETSLGEYSGKMAEMGFNVLDASGKLRDMGDVIEEIGGKWNTLSREQQTSLAQTMAGTRQYSRLLALFDNWGMYNDALITSQTSMGALQQQQDTYAESMEAHLQKLSTSTEGFMDSLLDPEGLNPLIDTLSGIMSLLDNFTASVGGLGPMLLGFGGLATQVFNKHIANGFATMNHNIQAAKENTNTLTASMEIVKKLNSETSGDERVKNLVSMKERILKLGDAVSAEEHEYLNTLIKETEEIYKQQDLLEQRKGNLATSVEEWTGKKDFNINTATKAEKEEIANEILTQKQELQGDAKGLNNFLKQEQAETQYFALLEKREAKIKEIQALEDKGLDKDSKEIQYAKEQLELIKKQIEEKGKQLGDTSGQDVVDAFRNTTSAMLRPEQIESAEAAIAKYNATVEKHGPLSDEATAAAKVMANTLQGIVKARIEEADAAIEELNVDFKGLEQGIKDATQNGQNAFEQFINGIKQKAKVMDIVGMVGAFGQLASAISTIQNLGDIWSNEDLTTGEKLLQTVTNLGFTIPMIVNGLNTLKKTYDGLTKASALFTLAEKAGIKVTKEEALAKGVSVATETFDQLVTKESIRLEQAYAKRQNISTEEIKENTRERLKNLAVKHVENATGKTKNDKGQLISNKSFKDSWKNMSKNMDDGIKKAGQWITQNGKLIGSFALVAAGIAVVTLAWKAADKAYNKNKYAMKDAAKEAQLAAQDYENVKSKYEEFKNTLSNYDDKVNSMEELTKGTVEYKEAVMEANEAALSLINSMDLLSGEDYTMNNGLIEFTEAGKEKMQEKQLADLELAQIRKSSAQIKEREATLKYEQEQFAREKLKGTGWSNDNTGTTAATTGGLVGGAMVGGGVVLGASALGATIGSSVPVIGTAIGAAVGLIAGGIYAAVNDKKGEAVQEEYDALNDLAEEMERRGDNTLFERDELREYLEGTGKYSQDLIDSLVENSEETAEQIDAIRANTAALKANYQQMVAGANQGNKKYQNLSEENKTIAEAYIANNRSEDITKTKGYQEAYDKLKDKFKGNDQDAYDEYLKTMYGDEAKNYRVKNQGGKNATLEKWNEETQKWERQGDKNSLSNADVLHKYAEKKALEMSSEDEAKILEIDKIGNIIDSIGNVENEVAHAVEMSLANGEKTADLSVLSPEQIENLKNRMGEIEVVASEEYVNAIQSGIDEYDENKYYKQLSAKIDASLESSAKELDIDKDVLEMYTESVIESNKALKDNKLLAIEAAKANINFAQGTEELQKALEDNLDVLRKWDSGAMETFEAANQVQDALEKMFGVKVDAEFIHENLNKIEKAAEGDIAAIEELSNLAAKDYTASIVTDENDLNAINSLIDQLSNTDIEIGTDVDIDTSQGIDAMNELLRSGAMTEEEMNKIFSSIGYKPNVVMVDSGEFDTSYQETESTIEGPLGTKYTVKTSSTTKTAIKVPQIVPEGETPDAEVLQKGGLGGSFSAVTNAQQRANSIGSLGNKDIKSGAQKNAEKMKYLDEERDVYHDINIELQKLESNLEKVQKTREKMVGGDIIDSLDKELGLLDKQIDAQKTKLEIAKLESQTLKENLSGQGVQFAEDGTITNYNTILDAKEAEINGLISAYKASNSEDEQEKIQKQIDKKQEAYDKFKENLERYDEVTFSELAELENEVSESISQKIELNIEKFTKDINLKVDLNEFKKEWRELQQGILFGDDDNFASFQSAADDLRDVFGEDGGLLTDQLERTQLFLQEYDKIVNGGTSAIFEDSAAAALEAAQEMHEMSMESAQQALEYINTLKDAVDAAFEEIMGLHDSILDTFDHTLAVIEHQIAVKELLFGNNANIDTETEEKFEIQLQKIEAAKDKMDAAQKRADDILNGRSIDDLNEDELYDWMEQQVEVSEAYEGIFSSVEEALETINTLLQQDIQNNLEVIEDKLTNNVGWDRLSERWEKDQELADVYLSGINKEYELQKLLNKINQDLLDKQYDSINAQKKINDFKNDELAILMQKDKLTQAELDRANKLYELTLLQIALDEARNNKSSMKLTRDSQGNYVYQYTTDEDAVAKAEQDLADKRNEIYRQNVEDTTQAISDFNSLGQEMQDEIQGIFDNDKFQEYLGLMASGENDSERAKELESWLYGAIDEITSDYNYRMGAAQNNAIASLGYIFKDLGIENVDLNNLTDEQRQILLDEGINMQRLGTLLGFDENTLSKTLTDLDTNIQSMVNDYINRVEKVTIAAGDTTELTEYYDTLDLIKLNTENLRDRYKEEEEKMWVEFNDMSKTLKEEIYIIEKDLKSLVGTSGLLAQNNKNITNKLQSNAESVSKKIDEAITHIDGVANAVSGLVSDINIMKKQIEDNINNLNDEIQKNKTTTQNQIDHITGADTSFSNKTYYSLQGREAKVSYDGVNKTYTVDMYGATNTYNSSNFNKLNLYDTYSKAEKAGNIDSFTRVKYKGNSDWMVWSIPKMGFLKIKNVLTDEYKDVQVQDVENLKQIFKVFKWPSGYGAGLHNDEKYFYGTGIYSYIPIMYLDNGKIIAKRTDNKEKIWGDAKTGKAASWYVNDAYNKKLTLKDYLNFDTGGYTGSWFNGSKDGRLAMLHQKELVLNEADTPRILDAVKLVREISAGSIIKDFEAQMRDTLSSLENQLIGTYANIEGMAAAAKQSTDQMLEQAVHIDASFPGVRDAREIEEALNNLVNVASQYAYENNK